MKKPISLILFFCFSVGLFSQEQKQRLSEEFIQFDTTVFFSDEEDCNRSPNICRYKDSLFFIKRRCRVLEDSCIFYILDVKTKVFTKRKLSFEGIKPLLNEHPNKPGVKDAGLMAIAMNDRYLILLLNDYSGFYLAAFDRLPGNDFRFKGKLFHSGFGKERLGQPYFLSTGKLFLYENYWALHPKEQTAKFRIFDIEKWQIEKEFFPECSHPVFTYFIPSQVMAITDSSIFYAQTGQYSITEYDFAFNPLHTIENQQAEWEELLKEKMDSLVDKFPYPMEKINAIDPISHLYSRIQYVFSIDKGLLVFYNKKGEKKEDQYALYFDIWKKENGVWVLAEQEVSDCKSYPEIDFMQSRITTGEKSFFWGKNYFFRMINRPPFDHDKRFQTDEEYKQACDEYSLENDDVFAIDFFKYSFSD